MRSLLAIAFLIMISVGNWALAADSEYAIVVSKATSADPQWKVVVDSLQAKHRAQVLSYDKSPKETLAALRKSLPRYICFVAKPKEAGSTFVAQAHHITRALNDDPYTDALWGILTGYDANCALKIVKQKEPLVIHRAAAATEIELADCEEGQWYCELNAGKMVRKLPHGEPEKHKVPSDTTAAIVDMLNTYKPQLFVTSGHASEHDWQLGYRYRNGFFRCQNGQLYGLDTKGDRHIVDSDCPKVYLPVGNCLMGHITGPDCMATAYMNSAGVCQMVGYTVPTWYGYAGWGMLDYFVEQPGRYTAAEAFYANEQALVHRLATYFPGVEKLESGLEKVEHGKLSDRARKAGLTWNDADGLLYDRDTLAFYGDPAWEARMAKGPLAWEQKLTHSDGRYQLDICPLRGEKSFDPVNMNGSQRGGRPFIELLPERIDAKSVKIVEGGDLEPVVTANFVLVPNPGKCDVKKKYRVVFTATK